MWMSEEEIVLRYKRAEKESEAIKVLSELNACSKDDIRRVLSKNGIVVTQNKKKTKVIMPEIVLLAMRHRQQDIEREIAKIKRRQHPKQDEINALRAENTAIDRFLKQYS